MTAQAILTAGIILMTTVCSAGWRADCRAQAHACRKSRGASLVTTTTTIPFGSCVSQNCAGHCIMVNGQPYVLVWDALAGLCSLPYPPMTTSTTTTSTTSTTGTP